MAKVTRSTTRDARAESSSCDSIEQILDRLEDSQRRQMEALAKILALVNRINERERVQLPDYV